MLLLILLRYAGFNTERYGLLATYTTSHTVYVLRVLPATCGVNLCVNYREVQTCSTTFVTIRICFVQYCNNIFLTVQVVSQTYTISVSTHK